MNGNGNSVLGANFDLELFGLELEYQIQTRIVPAIKRALDEKEAQFQRELEQNPKVIAERKRLADTKAEYHRRIERLRYVQSGQAAKAAIEEDRRNSPPVSILAQRLARRWQVPFAAAAL